MTNEEILKKAISKAVENGWKTNRVFFDEERWWFVAKDKSQRTPFEAELVIFYHSFAKAFWGEEPKKVLLEFDQNGKSVNKEIGNWQHHLQQMVLEEQPLKYLEKFL